MNELKETNYEENFLTFLDENQKDMEDLAADNNKMAEYESAISNFCNYNKSGTGLKNKLNKDQLSSMRLLFIAWMQNNKDNFRNGLYDKRNGDTVLLASKIAYSSFGQIMALVKTPDTYKMVADHMANDYRTCQQNFTRIMLECLKDDEIVKCILASAKAEIFYLPFVY